MSLTSTYECINDCPLFETIGMPSLCPFCGSTEVFQTDESVTKYERMDEHYANIGAKSRQ